MKKTVKVFRDPLTLGDEDVMNALMAMTTGAYIDVRSYTPAEIRNPKAYGL